MAFVEGSSMELFVDSFTKHKADPASDLVKQYLEQINLFLDNKSDDFLDLWHDGEDTVLYFNLNERERGGEAVRKCFRQIREVLGRVPIPTKIEVGQVAFTQTSEMAYAVLMEQAVSEMDQKTIISQQRLTLIWKCFDGVFKLVHMHSDYYDQRQEAISELLRMTANV